MNTPYNKLNNLIGWICFFISFIVYALTIEPNASYWDCGEYIAVSANLGVGHAPGAAFFQLLNAALATFSINDANIPWMVNMVSALSSAFTILFMFWTITHLAKKMLQDEITGELSGIQKIIVLGSGITGSLAFAFSDSFWFSAVEGEVYAMSSLVSAILFWMILKWENDESPTADRWILLISLTIGIAIGIHLMAILVIPAIGLIYYFKKYQKFTWKNFIIGNLVIGFVFYFVFKILFSWTMLFVGWFERVGTNFLGMSFNTGSIIALVLLILFLGIILYVSYKKQWYYVNKIVLSISFMLIGFSCWLMLPIRANANPPLNLNDPSDALGMLSFYNRDQYGEWPVLYGPSFTAYKFNGQGISDNYGTKVEHVKNKKSGKYDESRYVKEEFKPEFNKFFPRMWSPESIQNYETVLGKTFQEGEMPSLSDEIKFFLNYQVGEMYFRYVLWNFVGRQNDLAHEGKITAGNWKSGIGFIDQWLIGDQDQMPRVDKDNKANNSYFFIPLIFVIFGLYYQWTYDWKRFYVLLSIFLLTGLGIVLYTNNKIYQPRERDYAFVTSFYVLAIWLGLAVVGMYKSLANKHKSKSTAYLLTGLVAVAPILMATQNYDDHDRSGRYTAYDEAYNYLNDTGKDAILFVYGDNDTYPIWSVQEVQGVRRDVKVLNYLLLSAYWHGRNAVRKTFDAKAVPHSIPYENYDRGGLDQLAVMIDPTIKSMTSKEAADFMKAQATSDKVDGYIAKLKNTYLDNYRQKIQELEEYVQVLETNLQNGAQESDLQDQYSRIMQNIDYYNHQIKKIESINKNTTIILPTNTIKIPVDKEKVLKNKWVSPQYANQIVDTVKYTLPVAYSFKEDSNNSYIMPKSDLLLVDMICSNNWDRPMYFGSGALSDDSQTGYLKKYLKFNGLTYQFVPIVTEPDEYGEAGYVDTPDLLQKFNTIRWGNLKDKGAYFDELSRNRNIVGFRIFATRLADALSNENKSKEAIRVLDKLMEEVPYEYYESTFIYEVVDSYLAAGAFDKATQLAKKYQNDLLHDYMFYNGLENYLLSNSSYEAKRNAYDIANLVEIYEKYIKSTMLGELKINQDANEEVRKVQQLNNGEINKQKNVINGLIKEIETKLKPIATQFINQNKNDLSQLENYVTDYNTIVSIKDSITDENNISEKYKTLIDKHLPGFNQFNTSAEKVTNKIFAQGNMVRFTMLGYPYSAIIQYKTIDNNELDKDPFYQQLSNLLMLQQINQ